MSKRMLIDASHPEETRVVILSGNRVEEFDFESASRKPLKGNIYLAKVTRVEPSLQAAFVEYGGNRHGFLAFNEIHPDYYQIPVADRQALLEAQRADERSQRYRDDDAEPAAEKAEPDAPEAAESAIDPMPVQAEPSADEAIAPSGFDVLPAVATEDGAPAPLDAPTAPQALTETTATPAPEGAAAEEALAAAGTAAPERSESAPTDTAEAESSEPVPDAQAETTDEDFQVEEVAEQIETEVISAGDDSDDVDDEKPRRAHRMMRHYKIQEVIKKRQVILVQVVKEERGNKGAALTTYLSLAGRYCVLMPNSGRGGGISRKITNSSDRRRLKEAAESLDVPEGMGLIVRTAGASRTKQEIQRDYEYLLRLWDSIRDLTLRSSAPALVYEEGNLIKRAIRDQFSRDIEEIVVEGRQGFDEAQNFTKMLMPQQADAVKLHDGHPSLFQRYRVESQLDSMFNPRVQLKSGGYLIINQTEALVAIDVNSGRSTREHNIEDTAHKTNLEAAEEVARQLRLRDLAGLIVIDFIDMEENRNDRAVERRLKECLRHDRARIQIGRISPFGLLEMSRQRLRPGMVEGSTISCPHCNGTGLIRSVESLALRALRNVEEEAQQSQSDGVTVRVPTEVALYILNHKRTDLAAMEDRLGITVFVDARHDMFGADCDVEIGAPSGHRPRRASAAPAVSAETALALMPEPSYDEPSDDEGGSVVEVVDDSGDEETQPAGRSSRDGRRGRRRGRSREDRPRRSAAATDEGGDPMPVRAEGEDAAAEPLTDEATENAEGAAGALDDLPAARDSARDSNDRRRRRRGRRGGRRNGRADGVATADGMPGEDSEDGGSEDAVASENAPISEMDDVTDETPASATPAAPKPERKSPAAAIARFFGFGAKAEIRSDAGPDAPAAPPPSDQPPASAAAAAPESKPVAVEPEPVLPQPAPEPPVAHDPPAPEVIPGPAIPDEPPTTPYVADTTPQPAEAEAPAVEAPAPETAPAAEAAPAEPVAAAEAPAAEPAEPIETAAEDLPDTPASPAPDAEPAPVRLEPQVPAEPEKPVITVVGPAPSGPAKAGWWKKKD